MSQGSIEFYFDFSSPYGYLAAHRIDHIVERHHRSVRWRPILLAMVFKTTRRGPLSSTPAIWAYARRDLHRSARLHNIPFAMPEPFPLSGTAATRAFYWIEAQSPSVAHRFARNVFDAAFAEGREVSSIDAVVALAEPLGIDGFGLRAALAHPACKERAREATQAAIAQGVCGSPFFFVDGEPFWGNDRLVEVDSWLSGGGW